jgi:hypothetical protein
MQSHMLAPGKLSDVGHKLLRPFSAVHADIEGLNRGLLKAGAFAQTYPKLVIYEGVRLHRAPLCTLPATQVQHAELWRWFAGGMEHPGSHRSWHAPTEQIYCLQCRLGIKIALGFGASQCTHGSTRHEVSAAWAFAAWSGIT